MNQYNYFVRVPEALYDALRDGEITPLMFDIMTHLHRWANWNTGIVQTCNAKRLRTAMGGHHFDEEVAADRSIQRAVQGLDEAGWIISGYVRGMKVPYGVQITNFLPAADADGEKALIIPMPTKHWKETAAFQGVDEGAEKALTQAVSRRLKELDCSKTSLNKTVHQTSVTTDQPTNQPINQAADAALSGLNESQNPMDYESAPKENPNPQSFTEIVLGTYFPRALVNPDNLRLMEEINAKLTDAEFTYNGIKSMMTMDELLSYNWTHFADGGRKSGLRLRSLRQAHKAIVHGDSENGAIAQYQTHDKETCKTCMKNAVAEQKREAEAAKIDPMIEQIPLPGFPGDKTLINKIVRKPRTRRERQELLSMRYQKGKHWGSIAPWLGQDNCKECHGSGRPCQCIVMEEII